MATIRTYHKNNNLYTFYPKNENYTETFSFRLIPQQKKNSIDMKKYIKKDNEEIKDKSKS